jgi:hypothetical protein
VSRCCASLPMVVEVAGRDVQWDLEVSIHLSVPARW